MTDKNEQQSPNLPLTIHAQYIKDLSFENPNAPASLQPGANDGAPNMNINVNLDSHPTKDKGFYEVVLSVQVTAKQKDDVLFIAELQYGVVCSVASQVPDQHIHPLIMIEAPKMAFPFVRQILCDAVMGGGFPPLMINPVDFEGLYVAQYQKEQAEEKKENSKESKAN